MKNIYSIVTIILCFAVIVPMGVGLAVVPQKEFSENENRYLQQEPEFSVEALLDGSYTASLEQMCSDQILFRDFWISGRSELLRMAGNRDIGGVYLGEDGYLFEAFSDQDVLTERYRQNLSYVNTFASQCKGECFVMLVPSASDCLPEKLPRNHNQYDTEAVFQTAASSLTECRFLDLREALSDADAELYYRTDHHWTTEGACCGYLEWCVVNGITPREKDWFSYETLTEEFRGTLYSKVLLEDCAYDTILAPQIPAGIACTANDAAIPLYDREKLEGKDKYAVFFGGNYGRVDITGGSGEKLLVIKDSYANCFVPHIVEDYEWITMVDLRYFSGSLQALAREYDTVLFLYEITNFAQDSNLMKLLM